MYYVLNGSTVDVNNIYNEDFFNKLKEDLSFPYEISRAPNKGIVVKDFIAEEKLDNHELINSLWGLDDYDLMSCVGYQLDSLVSITDIQEACYGTENDIYFVENIDHQGGQFGFAELSYENNWNVISLKSTTIDDLDLNITKNGVYTNELYQLSDLTQFYMVEAIAEENLMGRYFSSFDRVYCVQNCTFNNWDSLSKLDRKKVLTLFYKEIYYVIHNEFDKLGHYPGKNPNRLEKIDDNLFGYRISNPNYRIYFSRKREYLGIVACMLKDRGDISSSVKNNLNRLKNNEYIKITS